MSNPSAKQFFLQSDGLVRASRYLGQAVRKSQAVGVMLVQIQSVERLAASVGHIPAGEVLDGFFERLCGIRRENDAVERLADHKFVLLMSGLRNRGHATLAATKVQRLIAETQAAFKLDSSALRPQIGVVMCPEHGENPHDLLQRAEIACLDGRQKNEQVCFFEPGAARQLFADWSMEGRLSDAVASGELELHYQPKIRLADHAIIGAEALLRWNDPELGAVSPELFIDVAEATHQMPELTQFAIQRACRQLSEWRESLPELNVAVNVSPSMIQNADIVDVIVNATGIWGTDPGTLTVEVTENALMADPDKSHGVLTGIREIGARVSIDDFGTGYSSLAYLKRIPADELKIDRTFVMGMLDDEDDLKIVKHSIAIASSFGLDVVAEGVESKRELDTLKSLQCDYAQGYYICKPVPADEFERICLAWDGQAVSSFA